ncbi:MAG: TerC family protein [Ktedonobacterales bacterium]
MLHLLAALGGIILVNLVLSGDNALVIGAAAAVLRIAFGIAATLLLQIRFLQALGGLILLVIAVRLLAERTGPHDEVIAEAAELVPGDETRPHPAAERSFLSALLTILVADITMSLDNVLAVGALAAGDIPILALGLAMSIALVLAGSALVAEMIAVLPWLLDVAALVLGWTAASMILHDLWLGPVLARAPWTVIAVPVVCVGLVATFDVWLRAAYAGDGVAQAPPARLIPHPLSGRTARQSAGPGLRLGRARTS